MHFISIYRKFAKAGIKALIPCVCAIWDTIDRTFNLENSMSSIGGSNSAFKQRFCKDFKSTRFTFLVRTKWAFESNFMALFCPFHHLI